MTAERGFQITKLAAIALYGCIQLALLVLWCHISPQRFSVTVVAATFSFLVTIMMGILSFSEHSKSLQPSDLLDLYLFLSIVLDAIQVRTPWLMSYASPIPHLITAAMVIKAGMILLESLEKTARITMDDAKRSPEDTSSIFNRAFFYWLNNLIVTGYRKVLSHSDLYSLGEELTAKTLYTKIQIAWGNEKFKKMPPSILAALLRSFKWPLLVPIIPRLCLLGFTFCQPLFINSLLSYLQKPKYTSTGDVLYKYLGAYAAIYMGLAVSNGFYWHSIYRSLTMIRGALVSAIYKKATEISVASLETSAVITLMSTDITNIENGLSTVHELWANFVQVCVATVFLGTELGATCMVPITVAVLCAAGSMWFSSKAGSLQTAWVEKTERRVGVVATMLASMKGLKMLGLTKKLQDLIQLLRVAEVYSGQRMRLLHLWISIFGGLSTVQAVQLTRLIITLAFIPILISPVLTFAAFIFAANANDQILDTTRMFTSISLLWLLSQPLFSLFQMFPDVAAALACLSRIETYLNTEARVDRRLVGNMTTDHTARPPKDHDVTYGIRAAKPTSDETANSPAITIRKGAFGWIKDQDILHDLNLVFPRSQLTMIIGPVACGKSTLCKALLGETVGFRGDIQICERSSEIAFCDQTSFLINDTLRNNILGFSSFDNDWYNAVVDALVLRDDISTFPKRDQTLIGTNGVSLSGGQKQRVAIARAVYSRKPTAIFDDVLSGLDRATEQQVFMNVFGPEGLLRSQRTTVVLATHAIKFLPSADKILVLGSHGTITEEGTFEDLDRNDGYVRSLSIRRSSDPETSAIQPNGESSAYTLERKQTSAIDKVIDESRRSGDALVYMYYLKAIGMPNAIYWLFFGAGTGALWTFPTLWLKWWSDANTLHPDQNNTMYLAVYAVLQLLALIFLRSFHGYAWTVMAFRAGTKMHWIILNTVMAAPLAYFDKTDIGVTTNRFSQDMELIDSELPRTLNNLGVSVFVTIGQLVVIATASPYIALIFPVLVVIFIFVQEIYLRTSRQLRLMDLEAKSPLYSHFLETLSGLATIRAFGWSEANCELNNKLLDSSQQPAYLLVMVQRWLNLVLDLLATALGLVVVFLAVQFQASSGFTGVALINLMSLDMMLKQVIMKWTELETSIGAVSRVKSFSETIASENLPGETQIPPRNWPQHGSIDIHNISASYNSGRAAPALRDLTLHIPAGSKIGICGRSGSGKSSLILSLFRMLDLQAGSITIDGINIANLQRGELRSRLNAIPQDPYFLSGTIRLNLDLYETASDDAMVIALKRVQLWETVQAHGGLAGELSATMLSHGQRQLFCLARAILRPGRIVVLDEATSSVDHKTDEMMQRVIREEFQDRTVIVIAHRLDTILDFDRIALLRNGELVECDSPANLLGRASEFRELYETDSARRKEGSGEESDES
ncbi:hypothetical protein MMC17_008791 [Xylographa soralifera]|nr:hypothetical protein [Xylographa soralifera]